MTSFNTGNPVPSTDFRDLSDNAANLDTAVNDQAAETWTDRLGEERRTFHGMEAEFVESQADREARYQQFLDSAGYEPLGDYAADTEITARNQVVRQDGELWRIRASVELPYTTTGDWGEDSADFVSVGDAALRQALADPAQGGDLVHVTTSTGEQTLAEALNQRVIYVDTIADLQALDTSGLVDGQQVQVKEYHADSRIGGGSFYWDESRSGADHDGGTVLSPSKSFPTEWFNEASQIEWYSASTGLGCWVAHERVVMLASQYGVIPISEEDQTLSVQAFLNKGGRLSFDDQSDIYVHRLDIVSSSDVDLCKSVIRKLPGQDSVDHLIRFDDSVTDAALKNGDLIGDALTHLNGDGEGVHNIFIYPGAKRIVISDIDSDEAFGDGIYLGDWTEGVPAEDITLIRVSSARCRRQGLSVTAARHMRIIDCTFTDVSDDHSPWPLPNGPWAGIDIEPNNKYSVLEDIIISRLTTRNCKGYGLILYTATKFRGLSEPEVVTITVDGHEDIGSKGGCYILGGSIGGSSGSGGGPNAAIDGAVDLHKQVYIGSRESSIVVNHWSDSKASRSAAPVLKMFSPEVRNYGAQGVDETTASGIVIYNSHPSGNDYGSTSGIDIYQPSISIDPGLPAPAGRAIYIGNDVSGREVRNCNIYARNGGINGAIICEQAGKANLLGDRQAVPTTSATVGFPGALATVHTIASSATINRRTPGAVATLIAGGSITITPGSGVSLRNSSGQTIASASLSSSGHSVTLLWVTETVVRVASEYGTLQTA